MSTILPIVAALAGVALGVIGTCLVVLPKLRDQDWIIEHLVDDLCDAEDQLEMDRRFYVAANKFRVVSK